VGVGAGVVVAERLVQCGFEGMRMFQKACWGSVVHFIKFEGAFLEVKSLGVSLVARMVVEKRVAMMAGEQRMVVG
jgi:hypothetical protein